MPQARRVSNSGRPQYGSYQSMPPRRRTRPTRPKINLPWRWLVFGGVGVLLIWFIWSRFTVSQINVTTILRQQEVKSEVQTLLHKNGFQDNLITLNTTRLSSDLATSDPALRNIHITRHWPNTIQVDAVQKQPALGWATGSQEYLLDRDGTIIGVLPPSSTLAVITDGSNLPVKIGQRVVTSQFITFTSDLLSQLQSIGINSKSLNVKETTFDLYVQTDKGYQLIFDTTRPAADEVADLSTVLKTLNGKAPSQYIDMRIKGKAYYK